MNRFNQLTLIPDTQAGANGRRPFDFYPTHAAVTAVLLDHVTIAGRVLEPCAGAGDMARVLRAHAPITAVATNDYDPSRRADFHGDAADPMATCYTAGRSDWVVTNPPFSQAAGILQTAYAQARVGAAFLLRLSFAEPANGRGAWLAAHAGRLSHLIVLNPRPSFTGDGKTDSVTAAWFVWQHAHSGGAAVSFVTGWDMRNAQ
jgi:hypothetical protein